jgi:hypothetical protein
MKLLLAFLMLAAVSASAQITNITFMWDPSRDATSYRFYDGHGTNRVLLGETLGLTFVVTNWNVSTGRTVSVTAVNMLGESTNVSLSVPPAPAPVQNLKPVPLSLVSPVPGVVEFSQDLADWSQRVRFSVGSNSSSVQLTWVQYPKEPLMFMRTRIIPQAVLPPTPTTQPPP